MMVQKDCKNHPAREDSYKTVFLGSDKAVAIMNSYLLWLTAQDPHKISQNSSMDWGDLLRM